MGTLYLVATPIGNLEDISARAIRILGEVRLIAAEDSRVALPMLRKFGISTQVVSYHDDSSSRRVDEILDALESGDVAVISDAGMPGISDPGSMLVRLAVERGFDVIPVPGPSAVIAAAAASGVADRGFVFGGFAPRQPGERTKRLRELLATGLPVILFEAPTRIERLIAGVAEQFPEARLTIGREITKLHEEWLRGTAAELAGTINARGEFVVVIEPVQIADPAGNLDTELQRAFDEGLNLRDAVDRAIAATGLGRKQVYARALEIRNERQSG